MNASSETGPVLVGVDRLDNVEQLVRTAGDIAAQGSGRVRMVTVAVKTADSPISVMTDEAIVREFAAESHELLDRAPTPSGVDLERDVVVARSPAKGLLSAVKESSPSALVVGWYGRQRGRQVLGSTVDTLVERAPCDLYVERVGRVADGVDSILFPVAGGPHVETAARSVAAIAARNDAIVTAFSVETGEGEESAVEFVRTASDAVQDAVSEDIVVNMQTSRGETVTDAIIDAAADHDIVVMGTTRQHSIRRKVAGSVPRRVVDRTDRTVILARNGDVVTGRLNWLRNLLGR